MLLKNLNLILIFILCFILISQNTFAYINYPQINPIAFHIFKFPVHWYGLFYLLSLLIIYISSYYLLKLDIKKSNDFGVKYKDIENLVFNSFLLAIICGRIGYMVFYDGKNFLNNPLIIFKIWEGGMSFHGGLIGVILATIYTAKKSKLNVLALAEKVIPLVPIGLALGRIGNFINDELWGRTTDVSWAVIFPNGGYLPRHPSQLYEAFFEGFFLLIYLLILRVKFIKLHGFIFGNFLLFYGIIRFIVEYFREPDKQLGLFFGNISMGQILSFPMIIIGFIFIIYSLFNKSNYYKLSKKFNEI